MSQRSSKSHIAIYLAAWAVMAVLAVNFFNVLWSAPSPDARLPARMQTGVCDCAD